ncbi:MAG: hypothetical protein V8T19_00480 [Senegalimassilia anaerobia]
MRETLTFKRFAWSNAASAPQPRQLGSVGGALQRAQRGKLLDAPRLRAVRHAPHDGLELGCCLHIQLQGKPLHCREHRIVAAQAGAQVGPPRRAIGAHIGVKLERRLPRHAGKRRQRPIGQVDAVPALHIGRGDIPVPFDMRNAARLPFVKETAKRADGPAERGVREAAPPA